MTTAKDTALKLFINDKQIKQVYTFVYLGHKLSAKNDGAVAVVDEAYNWLGMGRLREEQVNDYI